MRDYKYKPVLHNLYVVQRMSDYKIADIFNVSRKTITYWRNKHDIEAISKTERARYRPATFYHDHEGYEQWNNGANQKSGGGQSVRVHRLLAVAKEGVEKVKGKSVHHKNGIPWDNREENIEVVEQSEHIKEHRERGDL